MLFCVCVCFFVFFLGGGINYFIFIFYFFYYFIFIIPVLIEYENCFGSRMLFFLVFFNSLKTNINEHKTTIIYIY